MKFKISIRTKDYLDSFIGKNIQYNGMTYTIKDWQVDINEVSFLASAIYLYDKFSFTPIHKTDTRFFSLKTAIEGKLL